MKSAKLYYPYPVAVATFADGREVRMSVGQEQGKRVNIARVTMQARLALTGAECRVKQGNVYLPAPGPNPVRVDIIGEHLVTKPARKAKEAPQAIAAPVADLDALRKLQAFLAMQASGNPADSHLWRAAAKLAAQALAA